MTCDAATKLFIGGVSAHTTTEALHDHFSRYGRLIDAVVMQKNSRPRGFGFVTYESQAPAFAAINEPQWLDGRLVDVKWAVPGERAQERTSNKLFVGGLSQDIVTEDLKSYFGEYGPVTDAVVMVDRRTGRSRGFGFVRFAGGAQGAAALEAVLMDFSSHRLGGKWVEVKRAMPAAHPQDSSPGGSLCECSVGDTRMLANMAEQHAAVYGTDVSRWETYVCPDVSDEMMSGLPRSHARGRRGRRRKPSSGTESGCFGGGSDFSGTTDGSYSSEDLDQASRLVDVEALTALCPGTARAETAAAIGWPASPRTTGSTTMPLSPLCVEPLNCSTESMSLLCSTGTASLYSSLTGHTGQLSAGMDASPMKIACREDYNAREDFLATEVRQSLWAW